MSHNRYRLINVFGATNNQTNKTKRDRQAIDAIKAAIENPKTPSFPLIECEFPPLAELNKLGDGSLRSANLVDDVSRSYPKFPKQADSMVPWGVFPARGYRFIQTQSCMKLLFFSSFVGQSSLRSQTCQGFITFCGWTEGMVFHQFYFILEFHDQGE